MAKICYACIAMYGICLAKLPCKKYLLFDMSLKNVYMALILTAACILIVSFIRSEKFCLVGSGEESGLVKVVHHFPL